MESVACPASLPGRTCCFVTTPSISTLGVPFKVTTMTTRNIGSALPPALIRNSVCSGEWVLSVNDN